MPIEIIDLILLIAAAQGIFLTILIFHKHGKLFANRFLGFVILLYSIVLLYLFLYELGFGKKYPHLVLILLGFAFLIPPLHYLYAKHLVRNLARFSKKDWLHFLPFILYEGYSIPRSLIFKEQYARLITQVENDILPLGSLIFNWIVLIQGFIYMIISLVLLNRYRRNIKNVFSSIDKIKLGWLRNITFLATVFLTVFLTENIFMLFGINLSNFFNLSSFLAAFYVYVLGYMGLFKSEIFAVPEIADSIGNLPEYNHPIIPSKKTKNIKIEKYGKSGLSPQKAKQLVNELLKIMDEKQPYTDSDLTLNRLAGLLKISPHNLSEVINTQLHQNFFDFINQYRIEKVKKDLSNPEKRHLKLLAIACDAGFNAKSSFNAIFKKYTHQTPSEYRNKRSNFR